MTNATVESGTLKDLLSLVLSDPPELWVIENWSDSEKSKAQQWAANVHLRASDNIIKPMKKPTFLECYQ